MIKTDHFIQQSYLAIFSFIQFYSLLIFFQNTISFQHKAYKIIIQYDGTNFSGFQSQKNKSGIQDKIESSILTLNQGKKVRIYGASRTDAGVHALGQVAHFDLDSKLNDDLESKIEHCIIPLRSLLSMSILAALATVSR